MNYQRLIDDNGGEVFKYIKIGEWKDGKLLNFTSNAIQWANGSFNTTSSTPIKSVCSEPCGPLEAKVGKHIFSLLYILIYRGR